MKKYVLAVLLLLFSATVSSASLSFSNPVVINGTNNPALVDSTFINSESELFAEFNNTTALQPFQINTDFSVQNASFISFDIITSNSRPWTVSLLNRSNNEVISPLVSSGQQLLSFPKTRVEADVMYSIVVSGGRLFDINGDRSLSMTLTNIQVSEVPLPAAVWLFGTALLGGLAIRRRRQKSLSLQSA